MHDFGIEGEPLVLLLVEDDDAHAEIVKRNLEGIRVANRVVHAKDGQEAFDYLFRQGAWSSPKSSPRPGIVLLDLRLPKIDGLELLQLIKRDEDLRRIPVVVLTTSAAESDMAKAYDSGASSYLVKPVDFSRFKEMLEAFGYYWLAWNVTPKRG
jgi:CheY-like chemotaxis protein